MATAAGRHGETAPEDAGARTGVVARRDHAARPVATSSRPVPPERGRSDGPWRPASVLRRRSAGTTTAATPPARVPASRPVRARRPAPLGLLAAVLVFAGLFAVSAGLGSATGLDVGRLFRGPDEPPPRDFPVLDPSRPLRLTIPALKIEAPLLEVGLAHDGSVGVPPLERHREAGWFGAGPTPGQFGPALIVGHADTRTGPSVFHDLKRLRPGQRIEVLRDDRETAIFRVDSVEDFGKTELPVHRVYGDYSRPSLRLVTCGGKWLGGRQGYSDNIVVFASLVDSAQG